MAERDVTFKLTVSADPRAIAEAKEFESALLAGQARVFKSQDEYEKERVRIGKQANDALRKFAEKYRDEVMADDALMRDYAIQVGTAAAEQLKRLDSEQHRHERRERDRAIGLKIKAEREAERQVEADGRAALAKRLIAYKKAKAEELAEAKRVEAEKKRAERGGGSNGRAPVASEGMSEDVRLSRSREASRQLRENIAELSESVMRVGRGFVAMGLVGEKSMDKVKDTMLAAQATFDIFSGSLKVVNKLERAWVLYAQSVSLAKAAQNGLNASMAVTSALSVSAMGRGRGAARSGLSQGAAGALGAAGGGFLSYAGVGGVAMTVAGAGAAALGGAALGAAGAASSAQGVLDTGRIGGGARKGSFADTVGGSDYNPFGWTFASDAKRERDKSTASTEMLDEKTKKIIAARAVIDEQINSTLKERTSLESHSLSMHDRMFAVQLSGLSEDQKAIALSQAKAETESKILALRRQAAGLTNQDENQRATIMSSLEAHQERLNRLTQERGETEKGIAQTKLATARAAMDAARKELDTVSSRIKSEQDALKTAEERFGLMSRSDQTEVMSLLQKARAGQQLDAQQVNKLKSLGTKEAERLASGQARNLANGDYSQGSQALKQLNEANTALRRRVMEITEGRVNKHNVQERVAGSYDETGFRTGDLLSRRKQMQLKSVQDQLEMNEARANAIREAAARDTAMRRSVFGEERTAVARSLNQKSMIEAKISQQVTVVAKFENTAKQVADYAVQQIVAVQAPWIQEFEQRLNANIKGLSDLQQQRRQTAPGRS